MSKIQPQADGSIWYCKTCVLPNTRPNLRIRPDGSCDCVAMSAKLDQSEADRLKEFELLVTYAKDKNAEYDCVIPVSGGKDSTWQVVKALEHGLHPLCVTWRSPGRNQLGERNLRNLVNLGVDHIDVTINPLVERTFTRKAFERLGSPAIPMHMAIHALALQTAVRYRSPLVIYGENSADEYGNTDDSTRGYLLTSEWLMRYGATGRTTAKDWIDSELSMRDLQPYQWPSEDELSTVGVRPVFLGYFFKWDAMETFRIAKEHGFESASQPKVGIYEFADIDDSFVIAVHHYMKWLKYGFTRTWDNIALEIRAGRLSREEGLNRIKSLGQEYPREAIQDFCRYVGYTEDDFVGVIERFRNPSIWSKSNDGVWRIEGFPISEWSW